MWASRQRAVNLTFCDYTRRARAHRTTCDTSHSVQYLHFFRQI